MSAAPVSVVKVLSHYLTAQQVRRYVKADRLGDIFSAHHYYNAALRDLSIRDSEDAICNLIKVLELEPKHLPSLHLARTMLFGLNKLFHEAGGELYVRKYPNLNTWRNQLEQELRDKEFEAQRLRNDIALHQPKGFWRLLDRWFGQWRRKKLAGFEARLNQIPAELKTLQKQRNTALKLAQAQEYANVLSLVMEITMFPARFAWINEADSEQEYQKKIWYS